MATESEQSVNVLELRHTDSLDAHVIVGAIDVLTDDDVMEESMLCIRRLRFFRDREKTSFPLDVVDTVDLIVPVAFEGKDVDALRFLSEIFLILLVLVAPTVNRFMIFRSAPSSILEMVSFVLFCLPSSRSFSSSPIFVRWFLSCLTHPKQQFRTSKDVW